MKRILVCFISLALMFLVFTGCSSDKSKEAGPDTKNATSQGQIEVKTKDGSVSVETKDGSVSVTTDKSVELPQGYPSDIFPVYEGSFIYSAIETEGSYALTAYSKDEVKKVIAFYEKVLEGAKVNMDTKTDESLTSMGTKNGYAYTMDVGKSTDEGYQTVITISLQPAE